MSAVGMRMPFRFPVCQKPEAFLCFNKDMYPHEQEYSRKAEEQEEQTHEIFVYQQNPLQ